MVDTMTLTFDKKQLSDALAFLAPVAKGSRPVFQCVHIDAYTLNACELRTTNDTNGLSAKQSVPATMTGTPCRVLLNAMTLKNVVDASNSDTITLTGDKEQIIIKDADGETKLPCDVDEFTITEFDAKDETQTSVSSAKLLAGIKAVKHAVAKEERSYAINSVLIAKDGANLTCAATDGHRLSIATDTDTTDDRAITIIIPALAFPMVEMLLARTELVNISSNRQAFCISSDAGELIIQSVRGTFPDYTKVVQKHKKKTVVDATDFRRIIKRASILESKETRKIIISITKENVIVLSASSSTGQGEYVYKASVAGDEVRFACTSQYMLDALDQCDGETTIEYATGDKPINVKCGNFTGVIMPMREG